MEEKKKSKCPGWTLLPSPEQPICDTGPPAARLFRQMHSRKTGRAEPPDLLQSQPTPNTLFWALSLCPARRARDQRCLLKWAKKNEWNTQGFSQRSKSFHSYATSGQYTLGHQKNKQGCAALRVFPVFTSSSVTNLLLPFWQAHLGSQDAWPGLENTEVRRDINVESQRETASPRASYDTVRDYPAVVKYPIRQLQI